MKNADSSEGYRTSSDREALSVNCIAPKQPFQIDSVHQIDALLFRKLESAAAEAPSGNKNRSCSFAMRVPRADQITNGRLTNDVIWPMFALNNQVFASYVA